MNEQEPTVTDQILDLLLEALQQRQAQRGKDSTGAIAAIETTDETAAASAAAPPAQRVPPDEPAPFAGAEAPSGEKPDVAVGDAPDLTASAKASLPAEMEQLPEPVVVPPAETTGPELEELPPLPPSVNLERLIARMSLGLVLLIIIINIPLNRYGTSLARAMPDTAALVVRDGLLLKGSGDKVYVLEDNQLRWITTLDAFTEYGYRWEQVHEVDNEFLEQFAQGRPIHLLLKCQTSPHIYALEDGAKRWIKDIPTFEEQGYVWEDVRFVGCGYLRNLPDGTPIPADAGTPPQP